MGGKNRQAQYDKQVIGGEGSDEITFLKYLDSLYNNDGNHPRITNCHGGNPKKIVWTLKNITPQIGAYKNRTVLFDDDKGEKEVKKGLGEASKIPAVKCIVAQGCFECEMLKIYSVSGGVLKKARKDSDFAKKEFAKICDKTLSGSKLSYDKAFSKVKLDSERKKSKWLNSVISLLEC